MAQISSLTPNCGGPVTGTVRTSDASLRAALAESNKRNTRSLRPR